MNELERQAIHDVILTTLKRTKKFHFKSLLKKLQSLSWKPDSLFKFSIQYKIIFIVIIAVFIPMSVSTLISGGMVAQKIENESKARVLDSLNSATPLQTIPKILLKKS